MIHLGGNTLGLIGQGSVIMAIEVGIKQLQPALMMAAGERMASMDSAVLIHHMTLVAPISPEHFLPIQTDQR